MRQIAERLMVAGVIVSGSALWAGRAPAQSLTNPRDAVPAMSSGSASVARLAEGVPIAIHGNAARLSAGEIVARLLEKNQERLVALERYESERTYRVEYKGAGGEHHAEIKVRAEYTGPDHKRLTVVSESGSEPSALTHTLPRYVNLLFTFGVTRSTHVRTGPPGNATISSPTSSAS